MFGYVFPAKPELKVREFNLYKAIYCSLCRELNNKFGITARVLVNYDFVFLSLVGMAIKTEEGTEFIEGRCNTNPFKRQVFLDKSEIVKYAAGCLVITSYHKLNDDIADERFFKNIRSFFARWFLRRPYKKARTYLPDIDTILSKYMAEQKILESDRVSSYDRASDPSAKGLAFIFEQLSDDTSEKRILSRLGYLLGRFVYLADAGDDLKDDIREKRYNPVALKHGITDENDPSIPDAIEEIKEELFLCRGEIAACYNLLSVRQYKELLDNIIFLGLEDTIHQIGTDRSNTVRNESDILLEPVE